MLSSPMIFISFLDKLIFIISIYLASSIGWKGYVISLTGKMYNRFNLVPSIMLSLYACCLIAQLCGLLFNYPPRIQAVISHSLVLSQSFVPFYIKDLYSILYYSNLAFHPS